jgi:hypothetical protein
MRANEFLNEACWTGYKQVGMKKKGSKNVPNCVPVEENASGDSSLHDWFSKSKASDGTKGWVQIGGKYAGKPCAKQPGQTTKPKCGSSKMKRNLNAKEEEAAARRKRREDPNPDRKGKAKNVATKSIKEDTDKKCPPATQNITINLKNRQKAIDEYGYGPLNPDMPNRKFWMKKVDEWNLDSVEEAKQSLCGNCAAFDVRQDTLNCIASGIDADNPEDAQGVIDAGDLGYCRFLKFKCASRRTCDAWVTGGPLIDKQEVTEDATLSPSAVRKLQGFLNKNFRANLDVDGVLGDLTKKSIEKYMPSVAKQLAPNPNRTTRVQGFDNKKSQEKDVAEGWSKKYKDSINCSNPKGFSQKAHCAGKKKTNESDKNSSIKLGNTLSWPEFVNKISSMMKATGWKSRRLGDNQFMFITNGTNEDEWFIIVIDNVGEGFFSYGLGTVEEGQPYIDDNFKGELPTTEASLSELMDMIRDGYNLNETAAQLAAAKQRLAATPVALDTGRLAKNNVGIQTSAARG